MLIATRTSDSDLHNPHATLHRCSISPLSSLQVSIQIKTCTEKALLVSLSNPESRVKCLGTMSMGVAFGEDGGRLARSIVVVVAAQPI